jgi:hypothetical protein
MTRWGILLLVAYITLGLSPVAWRKATMLAVGLTVAVVAIAMASVGGLR